MLEVDPILIEQVLLNLLKNAAEAIDSAQTAGVAPQHRAARGAAPHARRRRRDRVQRHRHGPGPAGRGASAACTKPSSRPRPRAWASACRCAARIVESHRGRMRAQNLYNGERRFGVSFRLHPAGRSAGAQRGSAPTQPQPRERDPNPNSTVTSNELDSKEGHGLCRRRRRGRARFAAMAARRQGLPRQVLRLVRVLPVALRPARSGLPDRRHPHGRHERAGTAGPPDRAQEPAAGGLHHRPRRRADGGDDDEEGRDGFHREALQGRRTARPGRAHARSRRATPSASTRSRPAATRCCRA